MSSTEEKDTINLLSLDGGGVRGVSSLLILHEIMVKIKKIQGLDKVPKPCDYFHLIGGTSTGGLIAIMLGRLRMSTEEALLEYDQCSKQIFSFRNRKWTTVTEKYRASALKKAVEDLVRRRNMGEDMRGSSDGLDDGKGLCFVCVMPAHQVGQPRLICSYYKSKPDYGPVSIWEAARATTAASYYFKPMEILSRGHNVETTEECIDAAIGCNNPVDHVLSEAAALFGTGRQLGCLVSIGTGTRVVKIGRASTGIKNLAHLPKFAKALVATLKNTATDGEEAHYRAQAKFNRYPGAYFRFNVPDVADMVGLDEYLKIKTLKVATAAYLSHPLSTTQVSTAAAALGRGAPNHGLTLGNAEGIDEDQVVFSTQKAQVIDNLSRHFMARDDVLGRLNAFFLPRDTGGKPRREFLLFGLGGMGKTQIALKAADILDDRFKYVFRVDGTSESTVRQNYASICQSHCPGYGPEGNVGRGTPDEMARSALRWMGELSEEWLLIYDNHPDKVRLEPVLPDRNTGNVIYTSRSQGFLAQLPAECAYEVQPLSEEDSATLLLRISGRGDSGTNSGTSEEEMAALRALVAEAGCLPLAIENMGAYLRRAEYTIVQYLEAFRNRQKRAELLKTPNSDGTSPTRPALYAALDLSYEALSKLARREGQSVMGMHARFALAALNLLCFYHNEGIPRKMIERSAEERVLRGTYCFFSFSELTDDPFMDVSFLLHCDEEERWQSEFLSWGLRTLQQLSLVQLSPNTVSMHVMVQAWAQDRMDDMTRRRQAWLAQIVLIESVSSSTWNWLEQAWMSDLPPHFDACMAHEVTPQVTVDEYVAILSFKLGWYYHRQKDFPKALEQFETMLRLTRSAYGDHCHASIQALVLRAGVYLDLGRTMDADSTYLDALDKLDLLKEDILSDLRDAREQEEGKKEGRRKQISRLFFVKGSETGTSKARSWYRGRAPAAAATRKIYNPTFTRWTRDVASVNASLATLRFEFGALRAGRAYLQKAIEMAKIGNGETDRIGEDDEPDYDIWAWEDEMLWRTPGLPQLDTRRHFLERWKAVRSLRPDHAQRFSGHDYYYVLQCATADMDYRDCDYKGAQEAYERFLEQARVMYGPSDRKTLHLMREISLCANFRGLFEEAEEIAREAVKVSKAVYGPKHYQTVKCLDRLVLALTPQTVDQGPGSEIYSLAEETLEAAEATFSERHPIIKRMRAQRDRHEPGFSGTGVNLGGSGAPGHPNPDPELEQSLMAMISASDARPSKEELLKMASAVFREANRAKRQARDKLDPAEKRKLARQAIRGTTAAKEGQGVAPEMAQTKGVASGSQEG